MLLPLALIKGWTVGPVAAARFICGTAPLCAVRLVHFRTVGCITR